MVLAAVAACCLGLAGCAESDAGPGDDDPAAARQDRSITIYSGIIASVGAEIEREPEDESTPTVFVEGLDGATVPLEVQVGVVGTLEETLTVRFIDERSEAFDEEVEGEPVRGDGRFVELGTIPDGDDVEVAARIYRSASDAEDRTFRAWDSGEDWVVEEAAPGASASGTGGASTTGG